MCEIDGNHLAAAAAIIGHDGSIWAQSSNFPQAKPEEISSIMNDLNEPGSLAPTGLFLGGTKYMVIQGEAGAVIRGKKVTILAMKMIVGNKHLKFDNRLLGRSRFPYLPGYDIDGSDSEDLDESSSSSETIEDASSSSSSSSYGPLFELSELMAELPIKRGISKFYQGKSESFASLTSVKSIEDLAKKGKYSFRSRRSMKSSYGGVQSQRLSPKATISKNKKGSIFSSLGKMSSLMAN